MSFSTGGLFQRESTLLAELYIDLEDWDQVKDRAISENLLQARTESTSKRRCREIIGRLKTLSTPELSLLIYGDTNEQKYLSWLAACRRYPFVGEFATECLRESYLMLKPTLELSEYDTFYQRKSDWHQELEELKPSTKKKVRQVLFRMLREAGLLEEDGRIIPALFTPGLLSSFKNPNQDLAFFPVNELQGLNP